jgi:hypothetical protein
VKRIPVVIAVVAALSGCAQLPDPASPTEATAIEQQAEALVVAISGNASQKEAARFLERTEFLRPYRDCMADAGFASEDVYLPQWAGWTPNATEGIWMGELQYRVSPAMAGQAALEASAYEPARAGSVQDREGYREASDRCVAAVDPDVGEEAGESAAAQQLLVGYHRLIDDVDSLLGSIEPYARCMAEAGFDYRSVVIDDDGAQGTFLYLSGGAPAAPLPGADPSAEWVAFLTHEQQVLDADEACRGDTYRRGLAMLAPQLAEFEQAHAQELKDLAAGWDRTLAVARANGFTG